MKILSGTQKLREFIANTPMLKKKLKKFLQAGKTLSDRNLDLNKEMKSTGNRKEKVK